MKEKTVFFALSCVVRAHNLQRDNFAQNVLLHVAAAAPLSMIGATDNGPAEIESEDTPQILTKLGVDDMKW